MRNWIDSVKDGVPVSSLHLGGEDFAEIRPHNGKYVLYSCNDTRKVEESSHQTFEEARKEAEAWT